MKQAVSCFLLEINNASIKKRSLPKYNAMHIFIVTYIFSNKRLCSSINCEYK